MGDAGFFNEQLKRKWAPRVREDFANALLGLAGKKVHSSRAPGDDLLHASLARAQDIAGGEIAEAH